ncbi:FCD domain-containing protein [Arthrobacter sp. MDT2-16]
MHPIREAVEIIEVRAALEALCVRKATALITDAQIEELQHLGLRCRRLPRQERCKNTRQ